jgi:hypothetical protein
VKAAKALVGAAVAGLTALLPLVGDGVSLRDGIITAIAVLVGFNAVYWTKNAE